jgi:hypothetical protein
VKQQINHFRCEKGLKQIVNVTQVGLSKIQQLSLSDQFMLKDLMVFSKNIRGIPRICLGNVTVQLKNNFNRIKHRKTESQKDLENG